MNKETINRRIGILKELHHFLIKKNSNDILWIPENRAVLILLHLLKYAKKNKDLKNKITADIEDLKNQVNVSCTTKNIKKTSSLKVKLLKLFKK